jgi:DNA-binding NarL/FixJ family response regulator
MTVETTDSQAARMARDRKILQAVLQALAAEPGLAQFGHNRHLESLRDMTVGDFIDAVRYAGGPPVHRHLTPLPAPNASTVAAEMRARLSERELGVVCLIAEGLSNKDISSRLELSDKTVKNHISHILAKLKLTARTQVAVLALRAGIS